jgi:REP element-mobilizing transposase RayT
MKSAMRELPVRKANRLAGYDYSQNGAYFVTICIQDRQELLGKIVGATVPGRPSDELTELGKITDIAIKHNNRENLRVDCYVIMPNHIHIIFASNPDNWESDCFYTAKAEKNQ